MTTTFRLRLKFAEICSTILNCDYKAWVITISIIISCFPELVKTTVDILMNFSVLVIDFRNNVQVKK